MRMRVCLPRLSLSCTVLLPSDTCRKPTTSITAVSFDLRSIYWLSRSVQAVFLHTENTNTGIAWRFPLLALPNKWRVSFTVCQGSCHRLSVGCIVTVTHNGTIVFVCGCWSSNGQLSPASLLLECVSLLCTVSMHGRKKHLHKSVQTSYC
jgi:hypothetical protein